jgi:hypothetical protein
VLYAELNKNVSSKRLKEEVHLVDLSLQGSLFQIPAKHSSSGFDSEHAVLSSFSTLVVMP